MTSWKSSDKAHVRHYPLDIDLPFERYEHRHLAARDILVHRIVTKLLFPGSEGLAQAFETHRSKENGLHNFGPIKQYDKILARDLELLRKMLVTCSATDLIHEPFVKPGRLARYHARGLGEPQLPCNIWNLKPDDARVRVTVGEEILDLVRRHYFETDDPSTRLWLHAIRPLMPSSYDTLPSVPRAKETHATLAQRHKTRDEICNELDEKKWYLEDIEHLKAFQRNTLTAHSLGLYDGGAFLPPLRQPLLSSRVSKIKYETMRNELGDYIHSSFGRQRDEFIRDIIYPWPEAHAPRRVLHAPSWRSRLQKQQWFRHRLYATPVDFASGRTGRGLDRDGIWSTGRWTDEEGDRGRMARRQRRRASSEPPPRVFTSARLPWSFHNPREILIFPKMNLATIDRRSRRRSLSRTRVAEMFDWNSVLMAQSGKERPPGQLQELPQKHLDKGPLYFPLMTDTKPTCVHEVKQCLDNIRRYGIDLDGISLNVLILLQSRAVLRNACCHVTNPSFCANCTSAGHLTSRCPKPCGFCGAPGPNTLYPTNPQVSRRRLLSKFADDEDQPVGQHGQLHIASDCPVAKHNRCKCGPFPQYHVATKCPVLCSRNCGNNHPPGHFRHRSAMTCRARCCMCGMKGHSGQQCKLKRCRCGGAHLGQDCRWQVECRVKGCDKFLCGVHCIDCGIDRRELQEGLSFYGRRCPLCLAEDRGATIDNSNVDDNESNGQQGEEPQDDRDAHMRQPAAKKGRRKNIRKRRVPEGQKKDKEELPWYAPLQPRTRPIVTSKSGKRTAWRK